ncbi:hypothetical protein AcW1_008669 [Taiwanofungus camphoratus]|nr:hypothetical protein AcW1_008669 [Antrodia cinnamomea]
MLLSAIRRRRYQPFLVVPPAPIEGIETKYIQPVLDVANRDFVDKHSVKFQHTRSESTEEPRHCMVKIGFNICDPEHEVKRWLEPRAEDERLSPTSYDWCRYKKVFCIVTFVPPGIMRLEDFGILHRTMNPTSEMHALMLEQISLSREVKAPYSMITDEKLSVVLDHRDPDLRFKFIRDVIPVEDLSVRMALATLLYIETQDMGLRVLSPFPIRHTFRGALNCTPQNVRGKNQGDQRKHAVMVKRTLSDFDMYALYNSIEEREAFLVWKQEVAEQTLPPVLCPGTVLSAESHCFAKHHHILEPKDLHQTLPPDTEKSVTRWSRRRASDVDTILKHEEFSFEIEAVVQSGQRHYSQVFLGRVGGSEINLCLKLYDERFFPLSNEVGGLHLATDIIRREEAAYAKLLHLQGSLIPHSYGFHLFEMPDT